MTIDWSKVHVEDLDEVFGRAMDGQGMSVREEELLNRNDAIDSFIEDRCY